LCQWVQDNEDPTDPEWVAAYEQCKGNIIAAQRDVQGAVRYIRKNADKFGIDQTRSPSEGSRQELSRH